MYQNVDLIGALSVSNMMEQTKLKRFTIYRANSQKGSTPIYECNNTANNAQAVKCFKDWAQNIIAFNPSTNQTYDILLYDVNDDSDDQRKGKVKFSFALNTFNPYANGQVMQQQPTDINKAIADGISQGLEAYKKAEREDLLLKKINDLEQQINGDDDDDDDEEEDNSNDQLTKAVTLIKQINLNKKLSLMEKNGAKISGLDDDDDDLDDDDLEDELNDLDDDDEEQPVQIKKAAVKKAAVGNNKFVLTAEKKERMNKAIRVLSKSDRNLDKTLMKLANISVNNPDMFKIMLDQLNNMA